jgi:hypothetical protein
MAKRAVAVSNVACEKHVITSATHRQHYTILVFESHECFTKMHGVVVGYDVIRDEVGLGLVST